MITNPKKFPTSNKTKDFPTLVRGWPLVVTFSSSDEVWRNDLKGVSTPPAPQISNFRTQDYLGFFLENSKKSNFLAGCSDLRNIIPSTQHHPPSFKDLSNVKSEAKTSFFRLNVIEPIKVVPLTKKYTSCPRMCETFFFLVHILIFFHRSVEAMTFCKVGYFSRFEEFEVNWWDSLPMTADHSNQLHKHSQSSPPS